ncbi:MAG: competence type IV pilus major pilin ComGC [Mycoplasmatales bacterium]
MFNNKGFTLLEMLMVIFIISVLILLIIPNITKHKTAVNETGCEAYAKMVQTQVTAYEMAEDKLPSIGELVSGGYIPSATCPEGEGLAISGRGEVSVNK